MKSLLIYMIFLCNMTAVAAQQLKTISVPLQATMHILSPEPIQYVDISDKDMIGDLPLKNLLRLKYRDTVKSRQPAVVTIVGERFITQYRVEQGNGGITHLDIVPQDMRPLDISGIDFSLTQMKEMAIRVFSRKPENQIAASAAFKLKGRINHIYTAGNHIFLDISFENQTRLPYSVDDLRFKIVDKKVTKAENSQFIEIKPELTLLDIRQFAKYYRNVFVFPKISFPGSKQLLVELSENPISGRVLQLKINYQDLLDADVIPM